VSKEAAVLVDPEILRGFAGQADYGSRHNQLAELAARVDAPPPAQDLIRLGLPIGYNARAIAANYLAPLRQFPEPGVPTIVIDGAPVDGNSGLVDQLPG
jgi:hypothetical protein